MQEKIRILVAEDDSVGAQTLSKSLDMLGYDVTAIVSNGEEVIASAMEQHPDLIVMDITLMGNIDGICAAEQVRGMADIPVIFLTGHTDERVYERARGTEPYAFLTKPYDINQLGHSIDLAVTKHQYERRLRESEERYRAIFEASDNAMMLVDRDDRILMINREFERLSGYDREYVEQRKFWTEFLMGEDQAMVEKAQQQGGDNGDLRLRFEAALYDSRGEAVTVYTNIRSMPDAMTYVISMSDIRELKKAADEIGQLNRELSKVNSDLIQEIAERKKFEKQLQHQANHDPLTGLPNRVLLFELMKQSCAFEDRHNRMLALMLLDLDNFKQINDTMGHLSGDILLKKVARRLQSCMRQYDAVGRLGGDEFVVMANDIAMVNDIVRFTEKLLASFEKPFDILGTPVMMTASIGVAIYPLHATSVKSLLKMADSAMYASKKAGRNLFRFYSDSLADLEEKQAALNRGARNETARRQNRDTLECRPAAEAPADELR